LIVQLDPFGGQEALIPVVDAFNAEAHRLPWLDRSWVPVFDVTSDVART
jgi:hypothetical protein